jgi:hypothetical protein
LKDENNTEQRSLFVFGRISCWQSLKRIIPAALVSTFLFNPLEAPRSSSVLLLTHSHPHTHTHTRPYTREGAILSLSILSLAPSITGSPCPLSALPAPLLRTVPPTSRQAPPPTPNLPPPPQSATLRRRNQTTRFGGGRATHQPLRSSLTRSPIPFLN